MVQMDPMHPTTLAQLQVQIPEPSYALERLLGARSREFVVEEYDADDMAVFLAGDVTGSSQAETATDHDGATAAEEADWTHNAEWVYECTAQLMPPPVEASPMATMAVQRELRTMLAEQGSARRLRELGWYMPPDLIGDNLFQWILELHSFDPALPIAQDMAAQCVVSSR